MTVQIQLKSGAPSLTYFDVEDIIENSDWIQVILRNGSITFPLDSIQFWEVKHD